MALTTVIKDNVSTTQYPCIKRSVGRNDIVVLFTEREKSCLLYHEHDNQQHRIGISEEWIPADDTTVWKDTEITLSNA